MRHGTTTTSVLPLLLSLLVVHPSPISCFTQLSLPTPKHLSIGNKLFTPKTFTTTTKLLQSSSSSDTQSTNKNESSSTTTTTTLSIQNKIPSLPPISPMSKRLFLVRHGEVINPGGDKPVFYGALDVPLSPLGEMEAKAAAVYLHQFKLHTVAASPLSRAIYGAKEVQFLQQNSQKELKLYEGFKELDRGDWCGKTKDEIGADLMERFDACDESVTPKNGESYLALKERVVKARDELLNGMECGEASALVSHLQVTRCMLSDALGIPPNKMVNLKVATASVTCIDYCQVTGEQTVHFQSFKPDVGLEKSKDGAN